MAMKFRIRREQEEYEKKVKTIIICAVIAILIIFLSLKCSGPEDDEADEVQPVEKKAAVPQESSKTVQKSIENVTKQEKKEVSKSSIDGSVRIGDKDGRMFPVAEDRFSRQQ